MLARLGFAFFLFITITACASEEPPSAERTVHIGTHALHARVLGEGSPSVVIDIGIASRSEEWYSIQDQLAHETTVIVYDRAGYGASEPGPLPRDSGREMDELKALLDASSVSGPFVLVGHSLGALNIQVFAARYPEYVAGMVLLDPPPLGWLWGEEYPGLHAIAEQMTDEWQEIADRGLASSEPTERAEAAFFAMIASEHNEMFGESARLASAIETFGEVALVVIASGVPNPMFGDVAQDFQSYWADQSRAIAAKSAHGEFILAEESSHRLHEDAAELVLTSILSVVASVARR